MERLLFCERLLSKVSASKTKMSVDVERIAKVIAADLGIRKGCDTSPQFAFDLCKRYGDGLLCGDYPGIGGGLYFPSFDYIVVDSNLPLKAQATVIIHELIHRLLYGQLYESLNDGSYNKYDRREFGELVCRAVEKRYVQAGGFNVRKEWGEDGIL